MKHDHRQDSRHRSTPPSSASAFSSQKPMPISRYIGARGRQVLLRPSRGRRCGGRACRGRGGSGRRAGACRARSARASACAVVRLGRLRRREGRAARRSRRGGAAPTPRVPAPCARARARGACGQSCACLVRPACEQIRLAEPRQPDAATDAQRRLRQLARPSARERDRLGDAARQRVRSARAATRRRTRGIGSLASTGRAPRRLFEPGDGLGRGPPGAGERRPERQTRR